MGTLTAELIVVLARDYVRETAMCDLEVGLEDAIGWIELGAIDSATRRALAHAILDECHRGVWCGCEAKPAHELWCDQCERCHCSGCHGTGRLSGIRIRVNADLAREIAPSVEQLSL
jgi:hypothetical protein